MIEMKQRITRWTVTPAGLRRKSNGQIVLFDDYVKFVKGYQDKIKILEGRIEKIKNLKNRIKMLENLVNNYGMDSEKLGDKHA